MASRTIPRGDMGSMGDGKGEEKSARLRNHRAARKHITGNVVDIRFTTPFRSIADGEAQQRPR